MRSRVGILLVAGMGLVLVAPGVSGSSGGTFSGISKHSICLGDDQRGGTPLGDSGIAIPDALGPIMPSCGGGGSGSGPEGGSSDPTCTLVECTLGQAQFWMRQLTQEEARRLLGLDESEPVETETSVSHPEKTPAPARDADRLKRLMALREPDQLLSLAPARDSGESGPAQAGRILGEPPADASGPTPQSTHAELLAPYSGGASSPIVLAAATLLALGALVPPAVSAYNHLTRDRVAKNELRRRILERLTQSPGLTRSELADAFRVHHTTIDHHLRILMRFALVSADGTGRNPRFFVREGSVPLRSRPAVSLLRSDLNVRFLRAAASWNVFRLSDVARRLGVSRSTASYRAAAFLQQGLVERRGSGFALTAQAQELLASPWMAAPAAAPTPMTAPLLAPVAVASSHPPALGASLA